MQDDNTIMETGYELSDVNLYRCTVIAKQRSLQILKVKG